MAQVIVSIALVCVTALSSQLLYYRFKREGRVQANQADALAHLEKELAQLKDLSAKVEQLRLKQGLGR